MTTVVLSVCPLGKDGEYSYGGTASMSAGRVRPIRSLPATVIAREPIPAAAMSTTGVQDRRRSASTSRNATAIMGIPMGPAMSVNHVRPLSSTGDRNPSAKCSRG